MKKLLKIAGIYLVSICASSNVLAQVGIQIKEMELIDEVDKFTIIANMNLNINQSLKTALAGDLTLSFTYDLEIFKDGWIYDSNIADYQWQSYLKRGNYGQGYEFRRFGSKLWESSDSLQAALVAMQSFEFTFIKPDEINDLRDSSTYFYKRAEVNIDDLPNPLKVDLLTSVDWNFSSGWQRQNK